MTTPTEEVLKHIKLPFELHDFQQEDINRFAKENTCGVYWDMGLGKSSCGTLIGVYKLLHGFDSVIAIVPAALISEWVEWLRSLNLEVTDYRGTPEERPSISLDSDFIVMSPQIYQRDYGRFDLDNIYYIIDEATNMCNIKNLLYKMLRGGIVKQETFLTLNNGFKMPVIKNVQYDRRMNDCCLLTGTPINSPLDSYGLISITSPNAYPNYSNFERSHVAECDNFNRPTEFKDLDTINKYLTENAVIREVGDHLGLPEKIYKIVRYDLSPEHLELYRKLIDEQILVLEDGSIIDATEATKMYHLCQQFIWCPVEFNKKIAGLEVLDALVADTKRRLIFNKYRGANTLMMKRYKAGGCYGEVSRKRQGDYIDAFKRGELDTLVANPKSGGVGLNLQICNQVIFSELPVTANGLRQAEARCWRQGQKNTVVITLMVARNTIQVKLLRDVMEKDDTKVATLHTKKSLRKDLRGEL